MIFNDHISSSTATELKKMSGMTLINAVMYINAEDGMSKTDLKREILIDVNNDLGTNYQMKHVDNWVSGRVKTPKRVKLLLQLIVLQYLFGDDFAIQLYHVLND